MKLKQACQKLIINKDIAALFDLSQDISCRLQWDTYLMKAELLDGATKIETGVKAYTVTKTGVGIETEYSCFDRPHKIAVSMTNESSIFKAFHGSWVYTEIDHQTTELRIQYTYALCFPFNLIPFLIKRNLEKNLAHRLQLLKKYIETLD